MTAKQAYVFSFETPTGYWEAKQTELHGPLVQRENRAIQQIIRYPGNKF